MNSNTKTLESLSSLDLYQISAFDKFDSDRIVNVGFLKCEICRYMLDSPIELYQVFDCGRNGMTTDSICRYWSTCETHRDIVCNCISNDSGCFHCEICTKVEIIRVTDNVLSLTPNLQREIRYVRDGKVNYQWTDFDICNLCKYPICYAYEASFPYSASIYESSLLRLHHRILADN
jgi:hypothetical protein